MTYETFIKIVKSVYGNEENTPLLNAWYWIYMNIAHCYLELGDIEKAIDSLETEYESFVGASKHYNEKPDLDSIPTLKECDCPEHNEPLHIKEPLLSSLNKKWFDSIRSHPRFVALVEKVNALEY